MAKAATSNQSKTIQSLRRQLETLRKEKQQLELEAEGQLAAINKSQAVIEFEMDGTIITANENFLTPMGYTLGEVQGRHRKPTGYNRGKPAATSHSAGMWRTL